MMETYTVHEAQSHLQQLVEAAQRGETVLIVNANNHVVQLVPQKPRQVGSARGEIILSADFDAPLSDLDEYMR